MEKKAKELLDIMDILVELHKKLVATEEKKIEEIINQDWKAVEALLKESEAILKEIDRTEQLRVKVMKRMGYGSDTPISKLSESMPEDIYKDLNASKESLVAAIDRLKSINDKTKALLEDSLEIINFTLGLISNGNKSTKTYGKSGEEVSESRSTSSFVLDFKA